MTDPDQLFLEGVSAFNSMRFFDAHEFWEELWLEHKLEDADLIQGLIQLSVGYFHITNHNLTGARSLLQKCLPKLQTAVGSPRLANLEALIRSCQHALGQLTSIDNTANFNWENFRELQVYAK